MHLERALVKIWMCFVIILVMAGLRSVAFGQSATGTLTGTITDPKGLAMSNASVVVHNVDTGLDHQPVMTNDAGIYNVPQLQPGNYDVTASQSGFATVQHKGVTLQVGQTLRIDIEMPVAAQQALVTVTTEVPLLETEKTEISSNVSENLVSNLPVSSRRWEQFALLTPGVTPDGTSGGMSFHGINGMYNNNSVDGANNNSSYNGGSRGSGSSDGYIYSADSIREFQVASSGFGSEVGQSAGGSVNAVTKSGTNQWHGDLFYNGRTPSLNAVDPFAKETAALQGTVATQAVHQQNQWGGSLGGKLITDKLFFFVTDDGYRKVFPINETSSVSIPNLACPGVATGNPSGIATSGAGAMVTGAQCAAAQNYLLSHFVGQFGQNLRQDIELVKLDYQLNSSNHISGVANIRDWKQPVSPEDFKTATSYLQDRFAIANWTMVIGSNKVNELRYQYGTDNNFGAVSGSMPGVALSNIVTYGLAAGGSSYETESRHQVSDSFSWTKGAHAIKFGVDMNFIVDTARSANNSGGNYQYSSTSVPAGTTCGAGGAANDTFCNWLLDLYGTNVHDSLTGKHYKNFNQFIDNVNPAPPASFLFVMPNDDFAGFIQDTWKVRPSITINAGVRYDVQLINLGEPLPNSISALLARSPSPLPAGSFDLPIFDTYTNIYPPEFDGVQPRLGAAWNIRRNTVVRVSGGIFFAKTDGHNVKNVFAGASETTTACKPSVASAGCVQNLTFPNIFFNQQDGPIGSLPLPGAVPALALNGSPQGVGTPLPQPTVGIRGVDAGLKRPKVYSVDAAVEQQLPGNMNLSISYSFARGIDLPRGNDFNVSPVNTDPNFCSNAAGGLVAQSCGLFVTQTYDVVNANGVTTTAFGTPFYSSRAAIAAAPGVNAVPLFSDRVDPRTGVINGNSASASSVYNGAIVALRKPLSHGIEVVANYTISLATDDGMQASVNGGSEGQVGNSAIDPFNLLPEQGHSGTDTTHRFTSSVVYEPTFGKNASSTLGKELLNGWSVAGTIIAQTGAHYTAQVASPSAPSVVYSGYTPGSTTATNFTYTPLDGSMGGAGITSPGSPASGRVGWLAPGGFVLPNLYNVDLRLEKQFSIKERYHISIRGEAFNLFNSSLIQAVNNTAYDYASPGAAGCPKAGPGVINGHTNACMTAQPTFQSPTTTTGNLLGARQLQAGVRFEF